MLDVPQPLHPATARKRQNYPKTLLEREHYISPLQRSAIKNKAETTHSCIAVGEKGKAVWTAAGCGLRRAMVLVARHPWRLALSAPRRAAAWLRVYLAVRPLPRPHHYTRKHFLFHATFITPPDSSFFLCRRHRYTLLLTYSKLLTLLRACFVPMHLAVQRGKLICFTSIPFSMKLFDVSTRACFTTR